MRRFFHIIVLITILINATLGCSKFQAFDVKSTFTSSFGSQSTMKAGQLQTWLGSAAELGHQSGQAEGSAWRSSLDSAVGSFLNYGPYYLLPKSGSFKVSFRLKFLAGPAQNQKLLRLDVHNATTSKIVAERWVWLEEFAANPEITLPLVFEGVAGQVYEFRSQIQAPASLRLEDIDLAEADEGVVGEWFRGRSRLTRVATLPTISPWIVTHNGVWYMFGRDFLPDAATPGFCKIGSDLRAIAVTVQTSTNKGQSWSAPRRVITPSLVANSADGCSIIDGTTFFNSERNVWMILSQCLGADGSAWKQCLYSSSTIDGTYRREQVIEPRTWLAPLCAVSGVCDANTVDEGTPEFVGKKFGAYYFTFHGFTPPVKGYRGMVRTRDFVRWEIQGADMPGDVIYSERDCQNFAYPGTSERCAGPGASSSVVSGDFLYMMVEAPTRSLACVADQVWPVLLHRSHQHEKTGGFWQSAAQTPIITHEGKGFCRIQYAKFLEDAGQYYVYYFEQKPDLSFQTSLYSIGSGAVVPPPPPPPVNGLCGSAHNQTTGTAPQGNLCASGQATLVTLNGTTFTWSCLGANGGSTQSCAAPKTQASINGACGPAAGVLTSAPPPTNMLCLTTGLPGTVVTSAAAYTWTCPGENGGVTALCTAPRLTPTAGMCGSAHNQVVSAPPTSNLCGVGAASGVSFANNIYSWSCAGQNGGPSAQCSATQLQVSAPFSPRVYAGNSGLNHQIGFPGVNGQSWYVTVLQPAGQFLNFGPYVNDITAGDYEVRFYLKVDFVRIGPTGLTLANDHVLTLDVVSNLGSVIHAQKQVYRHDFAGDQIYTTISVPFSLGSTGQQLEFRSLYRGHSYVELDRIELHRR